MKRVEIIINIALKYDCLALTPVKTTQRKKNPADVEMNLRETLPIVISHGKEIVVTERAQKPSGHGKRLSDCLLQFEYYQPVFDCECYRME